VKKLHYAGVTKYHILNFLWLVQQLLLCIFFESVKDYVSQIPFHMPLNVIILDFS